jgi:hypothetical protein
MRAIDETRSGEEAIWFDASSNRIITAAWIAIEIRVDRAVIWWTIRHGAGQRVSAANAIGRMSVGLA